VLTNGGILWSDFDSGSPANDAFCFVFRVCQPGTSGLGLGAFESNTAPGDSGGPAFLNDRIVGVLSFGATAGSDFGDIDDELNSTFGEFSGHIYTGFHESWIQMHLRAGLRRPGCAWLGAPLPENAIQAGLNECDQGPGASPLSGGEPHGSCG
jgi:hypothetical protein